MGRGVWQFFFIVPFLVLSNSAYADSLKGIALVRVVSRHVNIEMHFAVNLEKEAISFVAIDDLGGSPFSIRLDQHSMTVVQAGGAAMNKSSSKVKSLLSMPITQKQLISLLWGNETTVRKKLKVSFADLVASEWTNPYPQHLLIQNGKNQFELTWVSAKHEK